MTQEQVLEHEVLTWARPGQDRREQEAEQFKHALRIADLLSREVVPPHNPEQNTREIAGLARQLAAWRRAP
jgi:hypothetical protein